MRVSNLIKHSDGRNLGLKSYIGPLQSGLSRREFMKTSVAVGLLSCLAGCKPSLPLVAKKITTKKKQQQTVASTFKFTRFQTEVLDAVLLQLFPDDGEGPDARDINAVGYLEWAMTDPQNIEDGDPDFIIQGVGWLDELSNEMVAKHFPVATKDEQHKVLEKTSHSREGENWMALLMYYLTEALLLDPIYGGNTGQAGWIWLEHQPGFPRPIIGKTYRDFE